VPAPFVPKRVEDFIFYYYAKLVIAPSSGFKKNYRFIVDTYKRLKVGEIRMSDYDRELLHLSQQSDSCAYCGRPGSNLLPRVGGSAAPEKQESEGRTEKRDAGLRGWGTKFLIERGELRPLTSGDVQLDGYRSDRLTEADIRQLLGFETRMEAHGFLKEHGAFLPYTLQDLEHDREVACQVARLAQTQRQEEPANNRRAR
jgi:hypothetical protein